MPAGTSISQHLIYRRLHIHHLEVGIRHVRIERENGTLEMLIRQLEQVLIHTSACLGHHPVSAQTDVIEFLGQITQLVDDDVHLIGINAQGLIVGLVMIGS